MNRFEWSTKCFTRPAPSRCSPSCRWNAHSETFTSRCNMAQLCRVISSPQAKYSWGFVQTILVGERLAPGASSSRRGIVPTRAGFQRVDSSWIPRWSGSHLPYAAESAAHQRFMPMDLGGFLGGGFPDFCGVAGDLGRSEPPHTKPPGRTRKPPQQHAITELRTGEPPSRPPNLMPTHGVVQRQSVRTIFA